MLFSNVYYDLHVKQLPLESWVLHSRLAPGDWVVWALTGVHYFVPAKRVKSSLHEVHTPSESNVLQFKGSHKQLPIYTTIYPGRQLVQGPLISPVAQPAGSWTQLILESNVQPGTQVPQELLPVVNEQPTGKREHDPSAAT